MPKLAVSGSMVMRMTSPHYGKICPACKFMIRVDDVYVLVSKKREEIYHKDCYENKGKE